jgi:hypothetical protein
MSGVIQSRPMRVALWCALFCALFMLASNRSDVMAQSRHTDTEVGAILSFLSGSEVGTQQPEEAAPSMPPEEQRNFDGVWRFTSAGCPNTGTLYARIVDGKIVVRGGSGQVDPDGTLHSVGAGNGMTLTAVGQLSGNTGSGTFNRSDGCVGSWIAIKRETSRRQHP